MRKEIIISLLIITSFIFQINLYNPFNDSVVVNKNINFVKKDIITLKTKDNVSLPDFWPSLEEINNTTTLNANWFETESVTYQDPLTFETYQLNQRHVFYYTEADVRIHALLVYPKNAQNVPALVLLHGHGGRYTDMQEVAYHFAGKLEYSFLLIDSPGTINRSNDQWGSTGPDSSPENFVYIDGPEGPKGAFLYHNVLAALRGVTLVQTVPFIDTTKIGIAGASQGGITTLIANGVESRYNRIKVAIPIVAAGNFSECIRQETYAKYIVPEDFDENHPNAQLFSDYFDPLNYCPYASAPTLMLCGTNDEFFPLITFKQTFDALPPPKAINIGPGYNHYTLYYPWLSSLEIWLDFTLYNKTYYPPPEITSIQQLSNNTLQLTVELDFNNDIDGVGLAYNLNVLNKSSEWKITAKNTSSTEETININWSFNINTTTTVALYPIIYMDGLPLICGSPIFYEVSYQGITNSSSEISSIDDYSTNFNDSTIIIIFILPLLVRLIKIIKSDKNKR